ncbi:CUB and sushi domain-containing protein 1-like isoform X4 [Branchiostoma lanceolatum]|uniref:CUB and sushi domain-containing protein 1-like isoform X4 n=1 Tax=Branchiostoma lanceolatum TaxID=7740 RepID=UPI0034511991
MEAHWFAFIILSILCSTEAKLTKKQPRSVAKRQFQVGDLDNVLGQLGLCSPPVVLSHGTVTLHGGLSVGDTASIACLSGYRLDGVDQITCLGGTDNGGWSDPMPTCVQECSGLYTAPRGKLYSPGHPGNYPMDVTCAYTLSAPPGTGIHIRLASFSTEDGYDFLRVYNGADTSSGAVRSFSGPMPGDDDARQYKSTSTQLFLRFNSDSSSTDAGFVVDYEHYDLSTRECDEPGTLAYGTQVVTGMLEGDFIFYTCDPGYVLHGPQAIMCLPGDNRVWSDSPPTCVAECGGDFHDPSGILLSPNYPNLYPTNQNCYYTVTVSPGNYLELTVKAFQTESTHDALQIRDGGDSSAALIGSYSGTSLSVGDAIRTTSYELYMWFKTDASSQHTGFKLEYQALDITSLQCDDPGTPSYSSRVETGLSAGDTITYTCNPGYTMHGSATVTCLTGDRRVWDSAPPTCHAECGGNWQDPSGTMLSPNYPSLYPINQNCYYTVTAAPGNYLELTVKAFRTESTYDVLQIRDGGDNSATVIGSYSGTSLAANDVIKTTSYQLYMWFKTDSSTQHNGFKIEYQAVDINLRQCDDPGTPTYASRPVSATFAAGNSITYSCDPGYTMHGTPTITCLTGDSRVWSAAPPTCSAECGGDWSDLTGAILSPDFPNVYPFSNTCYYTITVTSGYIIALTVDVFSTEANYDYLEIRDGGGSSATMIGRYSGSGLSPNDVIESTSNQLWLKFTSDSSDSRQGFRIYYDSSYVDTRPCDDPGTPSYSSRVVEGFGAGDKITYTCNPGYTMHGSATITCLTGDSRVWDAAPPTCRAECGSDWTAPTGAVLSPNYPSTYGYNRNCIYTISVQPGQGIRLTVRDFVTENGDDYLQIRDGIDGSATLIGQYSGSQLHTGDVIESTSYQLHFRFWADSTSTYTGFHIDYQVFDITLRSCDDPGTPSYSSRVQTGLSAGDTITYTCNPGYTMHGSATITCLTGNSRVWSAAPPTCTAECGSDWTAPAGAVLSPNYPSTYGYNRNCVYTISVQPGQGIRLTVRDFRTEVSDDYLQIRDGVDSSATLIGQYSGSQLSTGQVLESTSHQLWFKFWADSSSAYSGFHIDYAAFDMTLRDCDEPGTPSYSSRVVEGFGAGDSITYTCNPGYTMHGSATITCLTGNSRVWDAAPPTCRAECGSDWTAPTGAVLSPNYPSTYGYNRNCIYTISVQPGQGIRLTVRDFRTEVSDDYLQIRDGMDSSATLIGQYSGSQLSTGQVLESTSHQLWFKFWADSSSAYSGFHIDYAAFDITLRGCDDPGTPSYSSRVVEGFGAGDKITYTCNPGYTMHGSATITCLTGDSRVWDAAPPTCRAECGADWTGPRGAVLSPNYPSSYGYNQNCYYTVTVSPGEYIQLTVRSFRTEDSDDYLEIRNGADSSGTLLSRYSGSDLSAGDVLKSTSYQLYFKFHSDSSSNYQGFHIDYQAVDIGLRQCEDPGTPTYASRPVVATFSAGQAITYACNPGYTMHGAPTITCLTGDDRVWSDAPPTCVAECGGDYRYASSGAVLSPNYPGSYGNNKDCYYTITQDSGSGIRLTVRDFYLQSSGDYLDIRDGPDVSAALIGRYDGSDLSAGDVIESTGYTLWLRFHSDSIYSYTGFHIDFARYDLTYRECDDPGTPSYSSRVVEGFGPGDKITYTCNPGYTMHGSATITCLTGANRVWSSAPPSCDAECGSDWTSSTGAVLSPNYPSSYPSNQNCYYTITVSPGSFIQLTVRAFYMGSSSGDYLEIRDGGSSTASLISRYTSSQLSAGDVIKSTSYQLWFKFYSDSRYSSTGFLIDYTEMDISLRSCDDPGTPSYSTRAVTGFSAGQSITFTCNPGYTMHGGSTITCLTGNSRVWSDANPTCTAECGSDWTASTGAVLSPNYPSSYPSNQNCYYTITVSPGSFIQLTVRAFYTGSNSGDYLEIRDGGAESATRIGRYYGSQLSTGDVIKSTSYQLWFKFRSDSTYTYSGYHIDYAEMDISLRSCDDPGTPSYSTRAVTGFSAGQSITFTCNPGYTMHGGSTITCLTGNSRVWSDANPTCTAECGSDWTASTGAVLSPNYPSSYPSNQNCYYTITVSPGSFIQLTVRAFYTGSSSGDYLEIRDGGTETDTRIGRYSGSALSTGDVIKSTSYQLWFKFRSDSTYTYSGFHIDYAETDINLRSCDDPGTPSYSSRAVTGFSAGQSITFTCNPGYTMHGDATITCLTGNSRVWSDANPTCVAECGSDWTASTGAVLSPNYPSSYPSNQNCYYTITVSPGSFIQLTVRAFYTGSNSGDYLEIRDGGTETDTRIGRYSGSGLSERDVIKSTSYQLWFKFRSDSTYTYSGFHIDYAAVDISLRSCDDPGTPPNSNRAMTTFDAGNSITYTCNPGYTMHGSATITCLTGDSRVWSEDPPSCVAECGGDWREPTGAILSPNYPSSYSSSQTCYYTITVEPGRTIRLTVRAFYTQSSSDYLEIHDGPDISAALIGRYSGSGLSNSDVISSTTNQLWFKFRSDSSINYSGFKLDYEAV